MKKTCWLILLTIMAAMVLSMPCRAQEIVSTVSVYGLWALDSEKIDMLGDFERVSVTFVPAGAVAWLEDRAITSAETFSREELFRVRIFSAAPRPAVGISPLYAGGGQTRERLKIRCINPVF